MNPKVAPSQSLGWWLKSGFHQLVVYQFIPHFFFRGFIYPRWLFGISEPSTVVQLRWFRNKGIRCVYSVQLLGLFWVPKRRTLPNFWWGRWLPVFSTTFAGSRHCVRPLATCTWLFALQSTCKAIPVGLSVVKSTDSASVFWKKVSKWRPSLFQRYFSKQFPILKGLDCFGLVNLSQKPVDLDSTYL